MDLINVTDEFKETHYVNGKSISNLEKIVHRNIFSTMRYATICQLCNRDIDLIEEVDDNDYGLYCYKPKYLYHYYRFSDYSKIMFSSFNCCKDCFLKKKELLEIDLLYSIIMLQVYPIEIINKNNLLTMSEKVEKIYKEELYEKDKLIVSFENVYQKVNVLRSNGDVENDWIVYDNDLRLKYNYLTYKPEPDITIKVAKYDENEKKITVFKDFYYEDFLEHNPTFRINIDDTTLTYKIFEEKYKNCMLYEKILEFRNYVRKLEYETFANFHIKHLIKIQEFVYYHYWNPKGTMRIKILNREYDEYCKGKELLYNMTN
jgi:hypothetical protein